MAYMNQEKKAIINHLMKPILKKYNVKATLSVDSATIYLNIKSSTLDFIGQYNEIAKEDVRNTAYMPFNPVTDSLQVNPYWFRDQFKGKILDFLEEAHAALKGAGHYRNTDIQSDYFDEAYYYYIKVGQWNKPYQLIAD